MLSEIRTGISTSRLNGEEFQKKYQVDGEGKADWVWLEGSGVTALKGDKIIDWKIISSLDQILYLTLDYSN